MYGYPDAPRFVQDFLTYMETIRGRSKRTVDGYYVDVRTFLRFLKVHRGLADLASFHEIPIDDIDASMLQDVTMHDLYAFLSFSSRELLNSASARARKVSCLRTFFGYLSSKEGLLKENIAKDLESPKIPKSLPRYLSLDESMELLDAVDGANKERDYAMITLFLNCGMRLSELVGINLHDIRDNRLTVIGKGNKERSVYLNEACQTALADYVKVRPKDGIDPKDRDALFISRHKKRVSPRTVEKVIEKRLKQAGIDTKKYSVHKLRHTAATLMYQYGNVDIRLLQEILGHSELSTTQIYTHVDNEQLRHATDKNPLAHVTAKPLRENAEDDEKAEN